MYEGGKGTGKLILANPDSGAVNLQIRFSEPVPFREARWCRKALQIASPNTSLIADCEKIHGLGTIAAGVGPWTGQNAFEVEFLDHYSWHLSCDDRVLLTSNYGAPSLPKERFPNKHRLLDTYQRLFPQSKQEGADCFMSLFDAAINQRHGSILIVAKDAESEANRLREQGTKIEPIGLTPDLYRQVSGVDGAVIINGMVRPFWIRLR